MTLSDKQKIFTFNIHKLIEFIFSKGFEATLGEVARPQSQIWLNYYGYEIENSNGALSLVKKAPTSKTLQSRHYDRLAADLNLFKDGVYLFQNAATRKKEIEMCLVIGEFWLSLNTDNVWGGDWNRNHSIADETFPDPYHFEMKP